MSRPRVRGVPHPSHEECAPCWRCGESNRHEDMGVFFHCDDGSSAGMDCARPVPPVRRKRWWQR